MTNQQIQVHSIKVGTRFRKLDDDKIDELAQSISVIGLLHPIVIDTKNNLLSGHHRLEAHKKLGREFIECKQVSLSELENELVQIDENLINNELTIIEKSEHLIKRESILEQLGLRSEIGENQYTSRGGVNLVTTKTLSDQLGIAERKYQRIKQIYKINHTARQILKDTDISNNLHALLQIERLQDDSVQIEVASRIESGHSGNIRELIENIRNESGIKPNTQNFESELQDLINKYGIDDNRKSKILNLQGVIGKEDEDFYPTHSSITQMLLDRENLEGTIWEPACGKGDMSEVLIDREYDVLSTDLINRGYGEGGIDFLDDAQISRFGSVDNIVTNPPFKLGTDFVLQAKKIARKKICILNATMFLDGIKRYEMWLDKDFPLKTMYQFSGRVAFRKNKIVDQSLSPGGWISWAWFVFERGYVGKPTIEWILPKLNSKT